MQLVSRFLCCNLPTFSKQLQIFPHRIQGLNYQPLRCDISVLPLILKAVFINRFFRLMFFIHVLFTTIYHFLSHFQKLCTFTSYFVHLATFIGMS